MKITRILLEYILESQGVGKYGRLNNNMRRFDTYLIGLKRRVKKA